jgi:hypothetical protein
MLAAMQFDATRQENAADFAFREAQASRMSPSKYERYQAIIAATPDIDPDLAERLAG